MTQQTGITEAICESQGSERVVRFIDHADLKSEIVEMIDNGNLHGLFYDNKGNIVAEDIWGDLHEAQ